MAPWGQIAKPFCGHFALNCIKTIIGAGMVGYGVALAVLPAGKNNDLGDKNNSDVVPGSTKDTRNPHDQLIHKYITVATTIGFGLFLSLPSLTSQIVWETMIPGITATDIAYDLGTENVIRIFPKWSLKKPDLSSLVPSKEKLGGLIREADTIAKTP